MHQVIVIGAGPAGLTAALELLRSGVKDVVVLEQDSQVGGISRTVEYNGNRMDIGGHRFFSKSSVIMDWWKTLLPIQDVSDSDCNDDVMLIRNGSSGFFGDVHVQKSLGQAHPTNLSFTSCSDFILSSRYSSSLKP